jgi:hypothetical protein
MRLARSCQPIHPISLLWHAGSAYRFFRKMHFKKAHFLGQQLKNGLDEVAAARQISRNVAASPAPLQRLHGVGVPPCHLEVVNVAPDTKFRIAKM